MNEHMEILLPDEVYDNVMRAAGYVSGKDFDKALRYESYSKRAKIARQLAIENGGILKYIRG